jgi:energy-coupling factor transport system permease protein
MVVLTSSVPVTMAVLVIAIASLALWGGLGAGRLVRVSTLLVAATVVMTLSLSLLVRPDLTAGTTLLWSIGDWEYRTGALLIAWTTGTRVGALIAVTLVTGLTTSGRDLVLACVQQLRLPYRIGYVALTSVQSIPRLRRELDTIRAAHTVRGAPVGRGPVTTVRRTIGYAVPLLASSIRHAERVSMSMDARGFGSAPRRTERRVVPWRGVDRTFVLVCWIVTGLGYGTAAAIGVLGPVGFWTATG